MDNKESLHAELNVAVETTSKIIDATNLNVEDMRILTEKSKLGEKIIIVGNTKYLPPIGSSCNIKDIIKQ